MSISLCIHAHLYQPPREDPWLGTILTEGSAAPMNNWNERILRESYAPLAWARRLDGERRIIELLNCYEWTSFNVGPTLVRWMREHAPEVLRRMREGDEKSRERLGHGNAIAQCYHHMIMPLASPKDRVLQTAWAIDDFRNIFGRDPEGIWLPECAVDTASLETLADQGIGFVILAPRQAKAVIVNGGQNPVTESNLDISQSYRVSLPSGASINVVFYHGGLSQGIAFEGLLRDGERFWQRLSREASKLKTPSGGEPLLCLATDGETYGHHFTFGEMALAHVLAQGRQGRDDIRLTNIAAHIAANPPAREAVLHEPSSWSCVHGVERWRSDCGCSDGGHPDWNQKWRAPLRAALNVMRDAVDEHFAAAGKDRFTDAEAALRDYGRVLADPSLNDDFAGKWFQGDAASNDAGWKLLAMQEQALASFASCAWFFDDIARIEPKNAMTFALRALDLMRESGGPDGVADRMADALAGAESNQPGAGSGKDVFLKEVLPRRDDPATLCLLAWLLRSPEYFHGLRASSGCCVFPNLSVELFPQGPENKAEPLGTQTGRAIIRIRHETGGTAYTWRILPPSPNRLPDRAFVRMDECIIHIRSEDAGKMVETSRKVADLSRPMRDYLLTGNLETLERLNRPEFRAVAGNALSLAMPWLEAQNDVPRPEFWVSFIPYLMLESMLDDRLDAGQRAQVEQLLRKHFSPGSASLGKRLVTETMLEALENSPEGTIPDDARLAEWVRRMRAVMPDMDWWQVQNKVWTVGIGKFPAFAAELGFLQIG